jgi:hypothetical protein
VAPDSYERPALASVHHGARSCWPIAAERHLREQPDVYAANTEFKAVAANDVAPSPSPARADPGVGDAAPSLFARGVTHGI